MHLLNSNNTSSGRVLNVHGKMKDIVKFEPLYPLSLCGLIDKVAALDR